jgi:fructose-1,6-bisphosphatase I
MMLPEDTKSWELSFNTSNRLTYAKGVQNWIAQNEKEYAFRYLGALAGDFHRTLANGGMFMYPAIVNHPNPKKNRPQGKLRLMYEAAVVAFMCHEAGGDAVDETGTPILGIHPKDPHQNATMWLKPSSGYHPCAEVLTAQPSSSGGRHSRISGRDGYRLPM